MVFGDQTYDFVGARRDLFGDRGELWLRVAYTGEVVTTRSGGGAWKRSGSAGVGGVERFEVRSSQLLFWEQTTKRTPG